MAGTFLMENRRLTVKIYGYGVQAYHFLELLKTGKVGRSGRPQCQIELFSLPLSKRKNAWTEVLYY
jgi:hypothetical protein